MGGAGVGTNPCACILGWSFFMTNPVKEKTHRRQFLQARSNGELHQKQCQEISKRRLSATLISRLSFFRILQTLSHFHECKPTHLCSSHRLLFNIACGNPLFHAAKEGPSRLYFIYILSISYPISYPISYLFSFIFYPFL